MTAMTRGRLPARVYWTRRVLALVVVTAVVVGAVQLVAMLVGAGSSQEPDQAVPAAAEVTTTVPDPVPDETDQPRDRDRKQRDKKSRKDKGPVLADPEGPCTDRDIAVTPTAEETVAGSPVTFVLELRTILTPACTWEVSPKSLTVKITSGKDDIWFSRECQRSIPAEDVVLRNNVSTPIEVTWSSRRSDEECSRLTEWAMPGWYYIEAAAFAGEPSDLQFQLTRPEPEVVTETVKPEPKKGDKKQDDKKKQDGEKKRNEN